MATTSQRKGGSSKVGLIDLLKPTIPVVVSGVIGGVVALGGNYLVFLNTSRTLDIRMVLVGLSILKGDPPPKEDQTNLTSESDKASDVSYSYADPTADSETASEQAKSAREYAVHLLQKYSGDIGTFDEGFWEKWARSGGVPGNIGSIYTSNWNTGYLGDWGTTDYKGDWGTSVSSYPPSYGASGSSYITSVDLGGVTYDVVDTYYRNPEDKHSPVTLGISCSDLFRLVTRSHVQITDALARECFKDSDQPKPSGDSQSE